MRGGGGVGGGGRGDVGDRLESPVETHSIFVMFVFFACVVFLRFWGGGGFELLI